MITQDDLNVTSLGECRFRSPLCFDSPSHPGKSHFRDRTDRIRYRVKMPESQDSVDAVSFEEAGPREQIFFDPANTTAAIVTCGGLSPGLNNVIRSVYKSLTENYGVERVLGIRNGYLGLTKEAGLDPIPLTPELVEPIDKLGGTILGSSRGPREPAEMADFLRDHRIDILFCIGGDGTQRGAHALDQELRQRGTETSIIGIPKTIDNDLMGTIATFGFDTAVDFATESIGRLHSTAAAHRRVMIVEVMGRHAGWIAAAGGLAQREKGDPPHVILFPEITFDENGKVSSMGADVASVAQSPSDDVELESSDGDEVVLESSDSDDVEFDETESAVFSSSASSKLLDGVASSKPKGGVRKLV